MNPSNPDARRGSNCVRLVTPNVMLTSVEEKDSKHAVYECKVLGACTPGDQRMPGVQSCGDCQGYTTDPTVPDPEVVMFENCQAPGDALVFSAALESLHRAHPGRFLTAVEGVGRVLYDHNPRVALLSPDARPKARAIRVAYPAVNQSDDRAIHFMQAFCEFLEDALKVRVPLLVNRPYVYLTAEEKGWMGQVREVTGASARYWVVNAGHKSDFTAKWWGTSNYQRVVDRLRGHVTFVQVGETGHTHPPLSGVIDLRGRTDQRQLCRLVYHATGGLGPSTLLQHLCAAFEKPYVLVGGGREPRAWQTYPLQTLFSAVGTLPCCRTRACWKSRTAALNDGAEQDSSLCESPVLTADGWIPECLVQTDPNAVADVIVACSG
jgi:hypothetical protein